jgi:hypothetical protein
MTRAHAASPTGGPPPTPLEALLVADAPVVAAPPDPAGPEADDALEEDAAVDSALDVLDAWLALLVAAPPDPGAPPVDPVLDVLLAACRDGRAARALACAIAVARGRAGLCALAPVGACACD